MSFSRSGKGINTDIYLAEFDSKPGAGSLSLTGQGAFSSVYAPDHWLLKSVDYDGSKTRAVQIKVGSKAWTADTPVGQDRDSSGNPIYNGRLTYPQDQTMSPSTPSAVYVAVGKEVLCAVETATDNDKRTMDLNDDGDTLDAEEHGFAADSTNYACTASGGSFADGTTTSPTWTAPTIPGSYTLTCTINDAPAAVNSPKTGTRNDTAVACSVTVIVCKLKILRGGVNISDPQSANQTVEVVEMVSLSASILSHDLDSQRI